jgi:periplasmic divalent cation tolerance protein
VNSEAIVVICACPDEPTAARIAQDLVNQRLAACVNRLSDVRSTYSWQGRIQEEREVVLTIKTTRERYDALEVRLRALHPYEVPEIIALPIVAGSTSYLTWIASETRATSS